MHETGIDTGGTFTDLVLRRGSSFVHLKLPSTADDPSRAVLEGLDRLLTEAIGEEPHRGGDAKVVHGSTVATNALLERKGARTALVTTTGFADVLAIGRQSRTDLHDLTARKPAPLIPRRLVFEVHARSSPGGTTEASPSKKEITALIEALRRCRAESVAVGFLHSYARGLTERKVGKALAPLGIPVSLSHEVIGEYREYERLSTTAINAYVTPIMRRYLGRLEKKLGSRNLRIMLSGGGTTTSRTAAELPVHTVLSGPAGGVVAALHIAKKAGFDRIMTLDMGGTSTDVCLAEGELPHAMEHGYDGLPVRAPALDIHTVGAGGGSIARVDAGGALRVGPESAGADPGPACYGNPGGGALTVTDAHVILGRLLPQAFLGGTLPLDAGRSRAGMEKLRRQLRCPPDEAALGILEVANSTMERALKVISLERGHDPRDFTLVSFGGAGGLHAAELAAELQIPRVLVPRDPGLLSAMGLLLAVPERRFSRTVFLQGDELKPSSLRRQFKPLDTRASRSLQREGIPEGEVRLERSVDVRYRGQSHEVEVPVGSRFPAIARRFHDLHRKRFGHCNLEGEIEGVTLRVRAFRPARPPRLPTLAPGSRKPPRGSLLERRQVAFRGGRRATTFLDRNHLRAGNRIEGPAIIVEYSSTTVIPGGFEARVDRFGNLLIEAT